MKKLVCEMCGSPDLLKQEGVFVCQFCGAKYSVEEARKMMIEGTVEVAGTVRIDSSTQIDNLLILAKQAVENSNGDECIRYGDEILKYDINNWYGWFTKAVGYENKATVAEPFNDEFISAINKALERTNKIDDKILICSHALSKISTMITSFDAYVNDKIWRGVPETLLTTKPIYVYAKTAREKINFDDLLSLDETLARKATELYYQIIFKYRDPKDYVDQRNTIASYAKGIPQYFIDDANNRLRYVVQNESQKRSKGGCYIATAVYGSYDCPQVWMLRRYRDYYLAAKWYGRAFIWTYYIVSPTVAKCFGKTEWFKRRWRGKLDAFIERLHADGVEDTPYEDVFWRQANA